MKKILLSLLTLLTIGTACFAGCTQNTAEGGNSVNDDKPRIISQTEDDGDGEEKCEPPPCELCKPRKGHGCKPKPMPKPEPQN